MNIHPLIPLMLAADPARAADPLLEARYATLATCTLDGAASTDATAEKAIVQALVGRGATFLDLAQVKRGYSDASIRDLAHGAAAPELTAFDADVVLALDVRAFKDAGSALLTEGNLVRYQATIDASLISTDTGQALAVFRTSNAGVDATEARAAHNALTHAGEAIAAQLLAEKARPSSRVELWIDSYPLADLERLRAALLTVPGVKGARPLHVTPALTKLALSLDPATPLGAALVDAIHQSDGVGLTIVSFTDRLLRAEHGARVKVLLSHFHGKRPAMGERLAELIGAPLLDGRGLKQASDAPVRLGRATRERERQLQGLGLLEEDALFLSGRYFERGAGVDVEAELRSTRPGFEVYARDRGTCASAELMPCSAALAARLLAKLPAALARHRTTGAPEPQRIELARVSLDQEIFPARAVAYQRRGLGRLVVHNRSRFRATGGAVRVRVEGFEPTLGAAGDLEPGAEREVTVPFTLSKLPDAAYTAQVQVEVSYDVAGRRERLERGERLQVLGPSAMGWLEPESIAAFVSDPSGAVERLADAALAALPPEARSDPLSRAAALFHALDGLRYQGDAFVAGARGEVDDVQLPAATLARGAGDCDDLAVLYAALANAAGMRALFILTPSHILPAVDSELPAQGARRLELDPQAVIVHQGRAFIPVETTRAGASFKEAWVAARATVARARRDAGELQIVDLRKAWETYAALAFARPAEPPAHAPSFARLAPELATLRQDRALSLEAALARTADLSALDAKGVSERAAILVLAERTAEARELLALAMRRFPGVPALTNNLANAHLAGGEPGTALALYQRALRTVRTPESAVRVRLNAAVAAHVQGGAVQFRAHLFEAAERATTAASRKILTDFLDSLGEPGALTGAAAPSLERAALAARVRTLLEGNPRLRATDAAARADIAEIVYWLDPEAR